MFGDLNRVEIIGNITSDPEVRYTASGTAVVSVGVATNRRYNQNDEWKEETEFHNVTFWARKAEQIAERGRKGTRLFVEGRLQTRSWEDDSGKKNYKTEIVVLNFILLDRYERGESNGNSSAPKNDTSTDSAAPVSKDEEVNVEVISDDDLPF